MVSASLCAGKPLALFTRDLETALTRSRQTRRRHLAGRGRRQEAGVALTKLMVEESWTAAARRFAALHGEHDTAAVARELARDIDLLVQEKK